jgi:prepilin-type processing-associated H-X9-DG protein
MLDTAPIPLNPWFSDLSDGSLAPATNPLACKNALDDRHRGVGNVCFIDGHVDTHPWQDYADNIVSKSWLNTGAPLSTDLNKRWAVMNFGE